MQRLCGLLLAACLSLPLWADTLLGKVVAVADGDTITVVDENGITQSVRLAGIDAPEKDQSFGLESRQSLMAICLGRQVAVQLHKRDRYGRLVGKVMLDGMDVNLEQIRVGLAWHYSAYQAEQMPTDRTQYAAVEVLARAAGRGLWASSPAIPPWEWRMRHRLSP